MNQVAVGSTLLLRQAEAFAAARDWAAAISCCEQALQANPRDADALVQLSYVHSLAGHYRLARQYALRAHETGTGAPKVLAELMPRLRTFNAIDAMNGCIERMLPMSRMPIPMLIRVGAQLSYANQPERAIPFLDEARSADPDYPPTLLARAQVLMYLGRFDEARADVLKVLRRAPEIAQAYWLWATLGKQTPEDNMVDRIRAELGRAGRSQADIASLGFALHKSLDDLGDYDGAWQALQLSCRAKRATLDYSATDSAALFGALRQFAAPVPVGSVDGAVPVFIVGMHRSGTTLLEQMLAGAPSLQALGELYDFSSAMRWATDHHCRGVMDVELVRRAAEVDFAQVGRTYRQGLAWRLHGQHFFTDKLPSNFLNIGFICRALPQAKILHMVRDPMETCFSNLRELFSEANPYSYDLGELADFHNGYRELMQHWHAEHPGRVLDVDYATLTRDPEQELRKACDFIGLPFDASMLDVAGRKRSVVTASAVQAREGVVARQRAKWLPYAQQLMPLQQRLR